MTRYASRGHYDPGSTSYYRGRAGVVLEFARGQFASYVMHTITAQVDLEREVGTEHFGVLSPVARPTLTQVRMVLEGTLTSHDEMMREPPVWATAQREVEARRELEQRR